MSWREDANALTAIHSELEVETRVSEIGRSSFRMEYEIFYKGTDERVADGHGIIVWVDYGAGRSIPLPEGLKEEIRRFEGME